MKKLIIRFGSIGDLFSALQFSRNQENSEIFFSRSLIDFLLKSNDKNNNLIDISSLNTDLKFNSGNIYFLLKILKKNNYDKIIIYCQSDRGLSFLIIEKILLFLKFIGYLPNNININRLFHGGQYYWQINNSSKIKEILSLIRKSPNISIFYDGKESSKSLNADTILAVSDFLLSKFISPKITVYGASYIDLPIASPFFHNLTGKTSVLEIYQAINKSDFAIACDSGPMHIISYSKIPCIVFMSGRHPLLNWVPLQPSNYYIYDDMLDCLGCMSSICPRGNNVCVNSLKNINHFKSIFNSSPFI